MNGNIKLLWSYSGGRLKRKSSLLFMDRKGMQRQTKKVQKGDTQKIYYIVIRRDKMDKICGSINSEFLALELSVALACSDSDKLIELNVH